MKPNKLFSIKGIFFLLSGILLVSCKEKELPFDQSEWVRIYMPQAKEKPGRHPLIMQDTAQSILYGAAYGGTDYPAKDIDVHFKVYADMVAQFNSENFTSYTLLPEGSYELEPVAVIKKGEINSKPLRLKVKTIGALEPVKEYLLPVGIEQTTDNLKINPNLQITYFLIQAVYENYDRSSWTATASTQNGAAGATNERVEHALDGNVNTFWHSQYTGARPGPPHYISVDMSESHVLHGFSFSARRNAANGQFKTIRIEVSSDGTNWQGAGTFTLANANENTIYLSGSAEARYFKVWIDEAYGNITCSLAELNAF